MRRPGGPHYWALTPQSIIIAVMRRRSFLAAPAVAAWQLKAAPDPGSRVYALGDGVPHSPAEYAQLLARLTGSGSVMVDDYSRGGTVEQLELRVAAALGKETAVWLPTGTLANHLAVRTLAGNRRRVLVQAESHLFRDEGDCAGTLSGLHLVPLSADRATFTLGDVESAAADAADGRVATPIGAIQIETPVRRRQGERFDFEEMKKISAWARARQIGLHLDGARLFLESAYTNRPVPEYAALFDTVYVSMYKYFNAASGAVLAGPKALLADLYQTRRMFGGGMHRSWPFAAVALHYFDGFVERFGAGVAASEQVIAALGNDPRFAIERIPNGTNIFRLRVQNGNAAAYRQRLETAGINTLAPVEDWFAIQVNETWTRLPADAIAARFRQALG
jgi:threonine aldolase